MRGWGVEEFGRATPEFIEAARWALFVERALPFLHDHREAQAIVVDPRNPPTNLRDIVAAKSAAAEELPLMEALLYPEDDPDDG